MLKGSPFTLNFTDHKPIARDQNEKENDKPLKQSKDQINIFSQPSSSALKPDYLAKLEGAGTRKRGVMSSATTASTVAHSQSTQRTESTTKDTASSRVSKK